MYYIRLIINFRKTASDPLYSSHVLVDIPKKNVDLDLNNRKIINMIDMDINIQVNEKVINSVVYEDPFCSKL